MYHCKSGTFSKGTLENGSVCQHWGSVVLYIKHTNANGLVFALQLFLLTPNDKKSSIQKKRNLRTVYRCEKFAKMEFPVRASKCYARLMVRHIVPSIGNQTHSHTHTIVRRKTITCPETKRTAATISTPTRKQKTEA